MEGKRLPDVLASRSGRSRRHKQPADGSPSKGVLILESDLFRGLDIRRALVTAGYDPRNCMDADLGLTLIDTGDCRAVVLNAEFDEDRVSSIALHLGLRQVPYILLLSTPRIADTVVTGAASMLLSPYDISEIVAAVHGVCDA